MPATPSTATKRKPSWLTVRVPGGAGFARISSLSRRLGLPTVCAEARCPNLGECWEAGTATFMLLGDICTRGCRFCQVKSGHPGGQVDRQEPRKLAQAVRALGLSYVVLTMVDRDDLKDGGAAHVVRAVSAVKSSGQDPKVEILMGDFGARRDLLSSLARSRADVLAHNLETVEALTPHVRDRRCSYARSLSTLAILKQESGGKLTKSSLMLGLGESDLEIRQALLDLRRVGVDLLTLGQYLRPSSRHLPVVDFVPPERFAAWKEEALQMGFLFCASGPLVRSSYKAAEVFAASHLRHKQEPPASKPPMEV